MALFSLDANVSSNNLAAVRPVLTQMVEDATVTETQGGLHVEGVMARRRRS